MLDWRRVEQSIQRYVQQKKEQDQLIQAQCQKLLSQFNQSEQHWQEWKELAAQSAELVPDFDEPPIAVHDVNSKPDPAILCSTDGSQIYPSHHEIANVALVNVSQVLFNYIQYKDPPVMQSHADLYVLEDLIHYFQLDPKDSIPNFRDLVNDRRDIDEIVRLYQVIQNKKISIDDSVLALADGSLIQWHLQARNSEDYINFVLNQFIEILENFRSDNIPVAGYLSGTRSQDVVNLLRLVESEMNQSGNDNPEQVLPITDSMIFSRILKPNQRSTVFHSRSEILDKYEEKQKISFFYLHVGNEIARVEIPRWVYENQVLLNITAEQCLLQAHLGAGYPVILSEAHELAVIRGQEREAFYAMLEHEMMRQKIHFKRSSKQIRKRMPLA